MTYCQSIIIDGSPAEKPRVNAFRKLQFSVITGKPGEEESGGRSLELSQNDFEFTYTYNVHLAFK